MRRTMLALLVCFFPTVAVGQQAKPAQICKSYFEALYYDQGGYRLGLSDSQIKWWEKNHEKNFPSLCYSDDIGKVHYVIMWTTMATRQNIHKLLSARPKFNRQAQERSPGPSIFTETLVQSNVSTTSTMTYPETIPVTFFVDYCFIDVIRTFGASVKDDIENKRPAPPSVFGFEARRSFRDKKSVARNLGDSCGF